MIPGPLSGYSQQTHPARAVGEIYRFERGAAAAAGGMSMRAVDIGAANGNPECGPLFGGRGTPDGERWRGLQIDPRPLSTFRGAAWLQDSFPERLPARGLASEKNPSRMRASWTGQG